MIRQRVGIAFLALLPAACATSTVPALKPVPPAARITAVDARIEATELRHELEQSYDKILARSSGRAKAELVDADAALSMTVPDHRSIQGALTYFSHDLHDSIQLSLLRSARYKKLIDATLDQYQLPHGLAYLPVIESAYVTNLTSRAGAHGIWQFMPATAREYGLRVDWWVDERADPIKSTRAAAGYLRDLYRRFGDWSLVLAAYNAGPGRVQRALTETGARSFWELQELNAVPKETRGYVPTFFATLLIVSEPSRYGFKIVETDPIPTTEVEIQGPVSLGFVARTCGMSENEMRELNPQFRRGIVPPEKVRLQVKKEFAPILTAKAANLRFEDPDVSVASFTMRSGDTIASLAKRLKVRAEDIAEMNGVSPGEPRSGDTLYLPVTQSSLSERLKATVADSYYIVSKGETLYSIAKGHGLTVEELFDLNHLDDDHVLQVGEKLHVSVGTAVTGGM